MHDILHSHDASGAYIMHYAAQHTSPHHQAAFALHEQVMTMRQASQEPLVRHMRLVWWREKLEELQAQKPVPQHPLLRFMQQHRLEISSYLTQLEAANPLVVKQSHMQADWQAYFLTLHGQEALAMLHANFMCVRQLVQGLSVPALWLDAAVAKTYTLTLDAYGSQAFTRNMQHCVEHLAQKLKPPYPASSAPYAKALHFVAHDYAKKLRIHTWDVLNKAPPSAPSRFGWWLYRLQCLGTRNQTNRA